MDYRYIRAFGAVCKNLNFTKAANELGIAQSAVSRQISLFEDSLGKQLFIRSAKKVLLTPEGEKLFSQYRSFESFMSEFSGQGLPEVRIGALQGVLENWLIEKLGQIKNPPNMFIHVLAETEIESWLNEGKLDFAINSKNIETETISSVPVLEEEFLLISKERIKPNEAHNYRWISGHSTKYLNLFSKKKSAQHIKVNSVAALLGLVEKGLGIAVVPDHLIPKNLKVERQKTNLKSEKVYVNCLNYKTVPPHIKTVLNILLPT